MCWKNEFIPDDKAANATSIAMEYAVGDWGVAQVLKARQYSRLQGIPQARKILHALFRQVDQFHPSETRKRRVAHALRSVRVDPRRGTLLRGQRLAVHVLRAAASRRTDRLMGGDRPFTAKLDELLFTAEGDLGEEASMDISGLIGMYAHGNEPSHHIVYLLPLCGPAVENGRESALHPARILHGPARRHHRQRRLRPDVGMAYPRRSDSIR